MADPAVDPMSVTVGPAEAIRFGYREYQEGRIDGKKRAEAPAIGAPKQSVEETKCK